MGREASHEPTPAQGYADIETARQERDRLRREITHLVEVLTVWRLEVAWLRAR